MELFSITEISLQIGIGENTIRIYQKIFDEYLPQGIQLGKSTKYPKAIGEKFKSIDAWLKNGYSHQEIVDKLSTGEGGNSTAIEPKRDKLDVLSEDIRSLINAVNTLTQVVTQSALQAAENPKLDALVSLLTTTLQPQGKAMTQSTENSVIDAKPEHGDTAKHSHDHPDDIEMNASQFIDRLEEAGAVGGVIDDPDEPVSDIKPDSEEIRETPIFEVDEVGTDKNEASPYPNNQPLLFEEDREKCDGTEGTLFEKAPDIKEKAVYRKWIDAVLMELSGDGLSNKEICAELMQRKILTPKGKERWYPIGVQGMLNHIALKKKQQSNGVEDTDEDKDKPKLKIEDPKWTDEGYREYSRDIIFTLRQEGNTLKQIVEELAEMELKTRTGKERWNIGTISNILKTEKDF